MKKIILFTFLLLNLILFAQSKNITITKFQNYDYYIANASIFTLMKC
jgi:hypothetical protein